MFNKLQNFDNNFSFYKKFYKLFLVVSSQSQIIIKFKGLYDGPVIKRLWKKRRLVGDKGRVNDSSLNK